MASRSRSGCCCWDLGSRINAPAAALRLCSSNGPLCSTSKSLGDVDPTVAADPDEVVVERGVVDLREGDAVGDDRLTEQLVRVGHDVGRVQHLASVINQW
jgi:hypothetical protein